MPWNSLSAKCKIIVDGSSSQPLAFSTYVVATIEIERQRWRTSKPSKFSYLLRAARSFEASESRDKVYTSQALCDPRLDPQYH